MACFIGPRLDKVEIVRKVQKSTMWRIELALVKLCKAQGWKAPHPGGEGSIRWKSVSLHEKHGTKVFHISLLWSYGERFVVYMVIPDRMSATKFGELINLTESLGKASYRNVLKHGYLRDIEIVMDFIGHHTSDYFFHLRGAHSSKHVLTIGQKAGSSYSGKSESPTELCVYNKGEQQLAKGLPAPIKKLLRIEVRLHGRKIPVTDLEALPNVFEKCWVCPRAALLAITHWHPIQGDWLLFQKRCAANGVAAALSAAPNHLVAKFRKLLKDNQAAWWHPEMAWHAFGPNALKQLLADLPA